MDFKTRGQNIPSCSSLGRIKNCGGSWALSKGVPDESTKDADKGTDVHDALKQIVLGKLPNPQTETEQLAWRFWGHIQKQAFAFFGDDELEWRAEERLWMTSELLEPILSGQFDVICNRVGDQTQILLFDAKSGWQSGDVPEAQRNPQLIAMAEILKDIYGGEVFAAVVREWACDDLRSMNDSYGMWVRELADDVHNGEYDVWHRAGLRTGEWCQFCPAKGNCPAYRESLSMVVAAGTIDMALETMVPENLVRILRASPMAEKVIAAAEKEARRRRAAGEDLPGIVWAKGNTKREIADEAAFGLKMAAEGIDLGTFSKTTIPIGAAYKAWLKHKNKKDNKDAKDEFNRTFKDCLEFSENAPSLTFES